METKALQKGTLLRNGSYRIESVIGSGGFGITYKATDLSLDRIVAIKEFYPKDYCGRDLSSQSETLSITGNKELIEKLRNKFLKEARNIAKLDHPDIVRIHTAFEENNTAYYVMDYIEGKTLSEIVKESGPLSVEKADYYIEKIGEALIYIHERNLNHLDIKPSNVIIRRKDDKPVLIDFGLSKQYDSKGLETSTTITGISHGYASPEQYNPHGIRTFSPKPDIYSLGASFLFLLTGETPPYAVEVNETGVPFPTGFPENLKDVIRKSMAPKLQRYISINLFLEDLHKAIKPVTKNSLDPETVILHPQIEEPIDDTEPESPSKKTFSKQEKSSTNSKSSHYSKSVRSSQEPPPPPKSSSAFTFEHFNLLANSKRKNINKKLIYIASGIIAVLIILFLAISYFSDGEEADYIMIGDRKVYVPYLPENSDEDLNVSPEAETTAGSVMDMPFMTSLGEAIYSGNIDQDSLPNGFGVARWEKGEGKFYKGYWVHGTMEGETTYIHRSGDTFTGTFKNNQYEQGRYTVHPSGEYFEGTFKDGQPDVGTWYKKNGKPL